MKHISLLIIAIFISFLSTSQKDVQPTISFSFDDGSTRDFPSYKLEKWNTQLLSTLEKHELKAILFVKGQALDNQKGKDIMQSWDSHGHFIGNHTYHHPYYNSPDVSLADFKNELLKNDSLINRYTNNIKLFRFPYLKEGNTVKKRDGFRSFLKANGYKNAHVTIDASDWYIDNRLVKRLRLNPDTNIETYKEYYVNHLIERALFYDSLALQLTGRHIKHNMLLHHNLSAALFLDDLILRFKTIGWKIIDADEAYKDNIYTESPTTLPAGESLIWALAKQDGKFEGILRYPAEDSRYEKDKMDALGL